MKVCVIQPPYSTDYERSDECFEKQLELMRQCGDTMDIIVLPESADIPSLAKNLEERTKSVQRYTERILDESSKLARRCNAMVFVNARYKSDKGYINATYAYNRQGEIAGIYFKEHPTPGEVAGVERDSDYSFEFTKPTVVEIEGIRFGFLTCYDFYFYENYANMARENLDIIIGCSHQRSDTHDALEIMSRFLAYNTNTYVLRSSVSMDENSDIGGASMIVAPTGKVLANLKSKVGIATAEIDPKDKYYKPAGFGNPPAAHYEYIEKGRRPWKYRPAGSAISVDDKFMEYPRTCAHQGFNTVLPNNTMPAYGAAIAMGADEIEFDLWQTKDGVIVSCHDPDVKGGENGNKIITESTYEELLKLDFGAQYGEKYKGMPLPKFEDILKKFACHAVMNIHVKTADFEMMKKAIELIDKYDCRKYVYFMADDYILEMAKVIAPDICRCSGGGGKAELRWSIVDRAISMGNQKVQLVKGFFNQEMIDKAHEHGIICNVFWADDKEECEEFLSMGIDTILTNDYHTISLVVDEYKKKHGAYRK